jgi:hypothetical protein
MFSSTDKADAERGPFSGIPLLRAQQYEAVVKPLHDLLDRGYHLPRPNTACHQNRRHSRGGSPRDDDDGGFAVDIIELPTGAATAAHHSVAVVPSPDALPASHSSHPRLKSA